jgi:two-component system, NtrC family, response regulator AtoC
MALHKNRAERARRAEHDGLVAAVESIGEGVICTNAAGAVMFMNPASEAWTGWSRADALGRGLGEVVRLGKPDGTEIEVAAGRVLDDGLLRELQDDVHLVAKNDHARPIGGTVAPIRDHGGRITGVALVFGEAHQRSVPWKEDAADVARTSTKQSAVIAKSESMRQLLKFACRVAASEASSILIEGESGVGKDVVARLIHENSRRGAKAFLALNCAAIPETLLESELFGYEKGAFTDAKAQKRGILELASGGTAFLDEIGELPVSLQAKLLRVLEEHTFRRLGGTKDIEVDLRVIAATNRQLRTAIEQGRFRVDLYYRLNVIQLSIPPLRERPDDILPLARHFVDLYSRKFGRAMEGLAPDAVSTLVAHDWPGNVRELRNTIERAMLTADGALIQASALGIRKEAPFVLAAEGSNGNPSLAHFEKNLVLQALEKTSWNQTKASQILKISRDALRYKMKKFNLKPPQSYAE